MDLAASDKIIRSFPRRVVTSRRHQRFAYAWINDPYRWIKATLVRSM